MESRFELAEEIVKEKNLPDSSNSQTMKTSDEDSSDDSDDINNSVVVPINEMINDIQKNKLLSFSDVFKDITPRSLQTAFSYTFSFAVLLIGMTLVYMSEEEDERAAAALIQTLLTIQVLLGISPLLALNFVASHTIGELNNLMEEGATEDLLQTKRDLISAVHQNGLLLSTITTPTVMTSMVFSKFWLTNVFQQDEHVAQLTQNFLRIYALAIPGLMMRVTEEQLMLSLKGTKAAMLLGLFTLGIGWGLGSALGSGKFGLPELGPEGVAAGFVVDAYLTAILYGLYLKNRKDLSPYNFFSVFKKVEGRLKQLKEILNIGSSISFTIASEMAISLGVGMFAGLIGPHEQSALAFINQFVYSTLLATTAFGAICAQELSQLIGAKQYENASRMGKYGLLTSAIWTVPIPLIFAIEPRLLTFTVSDKKDVQAILNYLVRIMAPGVAADSIRFNVLQQLRTMKDLRGSMIVSVSGLSLGMVMSGILGLKTNLGIYGVGVGYTIGIAIATGGLVYRWQGRIRPDVVKENVLCPPTGVSLIQWCSKFSHRPKSTRREELLEWKRPQPS